MGKVQLFQSLASPDPCSRRRSRMSSMRSFSRRRSSGTDLPRSFRRRSLSHRRSSTSFGSLSFSEMWLQSVDEEPNCYMRLRKAEMVSKQAQLTPKTYDPRKFRVSVDSDGEDLASSDDGQVSFDSSDLGSIIEDSEIGNLLPNKKNETSEVNEGPD